MDTQHATPELYAALADAQGEIENATKNAKNPHYRNNYADLAEVLNTIRPVFSKHGLAVLQSTAFDGALVHVTCTVAHKAGGSISSTASCVPGKTDAQGVGAATTYLRRYSLAAMAGIAQEDDDGQAAAHNGKPAARTSARKAPPDYPDESFAKNFPAWQAAIQAGRKTAEDVITMVSTRAILSDDQKAKIRACEAAEEEGV